MSNKTQVVNVWQRVERNWSADEKLRFKRNLVRRLTSYMAGVYLFVGSFGLIALAFLIPDASKNANFIAAKDIYMSILPVASGVIAYWFASREGEDAEKKPTDRVDDGDRQGGG